MASSVTTEEIEALKQRLETIRQRVKHDRKEAIRLLHAAGITDEFGKLVDPYRATQEA